MKDRMMKVKSSGVRTVVAKDLKTFDHMINFSIEVSVLAEGRLTNIYKYRKRKRNLCGRLSRRLGCLRDGGKNVLE